ATASTFPLPTHFRLSPAEPSIARARDGKVTIRGDGELRYTTDGSEPGRASARYEQPFALPRGGTVRAVALPPPDDADGADPPAPHRKTPPLTSTHRPP